VEMKAPEEETGIYAADRGRHHMDLGGGFRNAPASLAPFFSAYNLDAGAGGRVRKQANVHELEQAVQLLQQENESLCIKYQQEEDWRKEEEGDLDIDRQDLASYLDLLASFLVFT